MSNSINELDIYLCHEGVERIGDLEIVESLRVHAASYVQEIESLLNDPDTLVDLCQTDPEQISIAQIVENAMLPDGLDLFERELFVAEVLKEVVSQRGEPVEVGIDEDGQVVLLNPKLNKIVSPLSLAFNLQWKQNQKEEQLLELTEDQSIVLIRNYVQSLESGQTQLSRQFLKSFGESVKEAFGKGEISEAEFASALVDSIVIAFIKLNLDPLSEIPGIKQALLSVLLGKTDYEHGELEKYKHNHHADQIYFYLGDILDVFLIEELYMDPRRIRGISKEVDRYIESLLTEQRVGRTKQRRLDPKYITRLNTVAKHLDFQIVR